MRGFFSSLSVYVFNLREDFHEFAGAHFHGGWTGFFVRVPFTRLSAFIEWREVNVGLGQEMTGPRDWSFYLGRVQGVLSLDPKASA